MAKKDHATCLWNEEMKQGWKTAMISRLKFHGALHLHGTVADTCRSIHTVRKWFRRLVESGDAIQDMQNPDIIMLNHRKG